MWAEWCSLFPSGLQCFPINWEEMHGILWFCCFNTPHLSWVGVSPFCTSAGVNLHLLHAVLLLQVYGLLNIFLYVYWPVTLQHWSRCCHWLQACSVGEIVGLNTKFMRGQRKCWFLLFLRILDVSFFGYRAREFHTHPLHSYGAKFRDSSF